MLEASSSGDGSDIVGGSSRHESLKDKARRIGASLKTSAVGPLLAAPDVVQLASEWDQWEAESGGLTADGWCRKALGEPLSWFSRRALAAKLHPSVKRVLHHDAAVWLLNKSLPPESVEEAMRRAVTKSRKENGHPITKSMLADLLVYGDDPLIGRTPRGTACAGCVMLEIKVEQLQAENGALSDALRKAGVDVGAAPAAIERLSTGE